MIFSELWMREWVSIPVDREVLVEQLTMAGLEVDNTEAVAGVFSGVVVAEVIAVEQHPDADNLRVCQVSDGTNVVQVICGASNVRPRLKVPFAQVNALLPGEQTDKPLQIKKARLRGMESNGMLCSAAELGLADSSEGLLELPDDAEIGVDVRSYLQLDDVSIALDLTPNRGDCLGVIGLAREIAALNRSSVVEPEMPSVPAASDITFPITIHVPDSCARYLGRVISGVNASAKSPLWMQERLRRCGLRSIDAIVDVTNYVLLELGQPMHAFDLDRLDTGIHVRMADNGEKLTLLDGKEIELNSDTMVIADATKALAIAGVMGGEASSVSAQTKDVFLECAFFAPLAVAGRARRYGLHTDSSHRYERGVDFQIQHKAMERATALLTAVSGGTPGPVNECIGNLPKTLNVQLDYSNVSRILGLTIPEPEIIDILTRLGLEVRQQSLNSLCVAVPSFRFDISIEADLIEEVARVYGYNRLPKTRSSARLALQPQPEVTNDLNRIKERLVSLGYQEVITYSFVEPGLLHKVKPTPSPVSVQNPISSDMSVMRTTLWAGLLSTYMHNANRQQDRIRIFETGQVFLRHGIQISQPSYIAGLLSGSRAPELWCNDKKSVDFFDLKGDIESLLGLGANTNNVEFFPAYNSALHDGQCAKVHLNGEEIGVFGALHPGLERELGINNNVYLFELQLEKVQQAVLPTAAELSRYPEVNRDLALIVDKSICADQVIHVIRKNAGELLKDLRIFDVYQGDAIEKNKKSIALGLTLQHPSRTLGDDDINTIINSCVKELEDTFNAKLRN